MGLHNIMNMNTDKKMPSMQKANTKFLRERNTTEPQNNIHMYNSCTIQFRPSSVPARATAIATNCSSYFKVSLCPNPPPHNCQRHFVKVWPYVSSTQQTLGASHYFQDQMFGILNPSHKLSLLFSHRTLLFCSFALGCPPGLGKHLSPPCIPLELNDGCLQGSAKISPLHKTLSWSRPPPSC